MKVVGLTGGIASGKSTVAARWRELGVQVIDADQVARDIVAPGQPALARIVQHFGAQMLTPEGTLNRPKLGKVVFSDSEQLAALNRITHPAIIENVHQRLKELRKAGHAWCVYEAALIVDNGLSPGLFELVVVICDPSTQHRRLMARNSLESEQAWQRIRSQVSNDERREAADVIIDNDGDLNQLLSAADAVAEGYRSRFGGV